jgi:uncharacterized SAM-binding protein YcdF (DUF218 family)
MFWLKKLLAPFLAPLNFCLLLLIIGIALLWFTNRQRWGKSLVSIATLLLVLASCRPVGDQLLRAWEAQFVTLDSNARIDFNAIVDIKPTVASNITIANIDSQADKTMVVDNTMVANQTIIVNNASLDLQTRQAASTTVASPAPVVRWIVVLGGGHVADSQLPATGQLSTPSLARLIEGIRIYRRLPQTKLILSGGPGFTNTSDGAIMAQAAQALGVPAAAIVAETAARDTEEQAQLIKPIVQQDQFILVTSANHLPRAMALFQKVGLQPIPAPADFQVKTSLLLTPGYFYPSVEALSKTDRSFYEFWGWWWAKVRGKI